MGWRKKARGIADGFETHSGRLGGIANGSGVVQTLIRMEDPYSLKWNSEKEPKGRTECP